MANKNCSNAAIAHAKRVVALCNGKVLLTPDGSIRGFLMPYENASTLETVRAGLAQIIDAAERRGAHEDSLRPVAIGKSKPARDPVCWVVKYRDGDYYGGDNPLSYAQTSWYWVNRLVLAKRFASRDQAREFANNWPGKARAIRVVRKPRDKHAEAIARIAHLESIIIGVGKAVAGAANAASGALASKGGV